MLLWCALATPARAMTDGAGAQQLVLAVTLDGAPATEPVLVRRQGTALVMRAADLRALGVTVPGPASDVALGDVPGLSAAVDTGAQTLALTRTRAVQHVRIEAPARGPVATTRSDWGAAVNYDLTAARAGRQASAAGLIDGVVYGPNGYFYGAAVVTTRRDAGQRRVQRLDWGFSTGDPGAVRRLTVGDLITGAAEASRPVRLAGVQVATDFDLRPDLVTFPVPAIAGSAAVPSALDLIVNGARRSAGTVRAGQFEVADLPVQTGVNTVTVAVRDALGRETRQTVSTYVSRALLRPGLRAFSLEAGLVRVGYGTARDRYADPVASGSLRSGLNDRLTLEAHGEASRRVGAGTVGATFGLGRAGIVSGSIGVAAPGAFTRRAAAQLALGYERIGRPVSVAAHWRRQGPGWYDLAADHGAVARAHQLSVTVGFDLARLGTVGVTLVDQGRGRVLRAAEGESVAPSPGSRFATLTYSVRIAQRLNLVANAGADGHARRSGYLSLGALIVFGRRSSGYAGTLARRGGVAGTAAYSRTALEPGDWGYGVAAAAGGIERVAADLSYQGRAGFYAAQVERTNGNSAARLSARGAVVAAGGGVLAADRLTGGFAVVDTHGQARVPVFRDNRRVGVTDRRGRFVVANLRPYEPTKISLDPLLLDDRVIVDRTEQWVAPAMRAGVPVRFAMRAGTPARVLLADERGQPIAAGSRATPAGGTAAPVGFDGELYLEDLRPDNRLVVQVRGGGVCLARFPGATGASPVQRIGPVRCVPERIAAR